MSKPVDPFTSFHPHAAGTSARASNASLDAAELESTTRAAEVVVLWGDEVLRVAHVSPSGGHRTSSPSTREPLGADRLPVVFTEDGLISCVVPEDASGRVTVGTMSKSFDELATEGKLSNSDEIPGARLYALPEQASARIEYGGLTYLVRPTHAARAIGRRTRFDLKQTGWVGLSLSVHAFFLVLFYYSPPHTQALSLSPDASRERLIAYLAPANERLVPETPPPEWSSAGEGEPGEESARAAGEEGQAGDPDERRTRNRMGIARTSDAAPTLARENIRENVQSLAAVGAIRALVGSWNAPTSPFGADRANGTDPMSAIGALMGVQLGANAGHGGLGMRGTGRGAGGFGDFIGVGELGTMGGRCRGTGCGPGNGPGGYGSSVGFPGRDRPTRVPTITPARASVTGALSPEAIRRVVRRHLPEIRHCYEQGLQANPSLEGRVTMRWMIAPDGRVQAASVASSDLGSAPVESCISQAVQRWTFPTPEGGGVVGVSYRFVLRAAH